MRLRSALLLLAVATAAPLLLLSFVSAGYVYEQANQSIIGSALNRNRATLEAIDSEIRGSMGVLRALSTSSSLDDDDYRRFDTESRIVLATQPSWFNIVLSSPDGRQLTNAKFQWGEALPGLSVQEKSMHSSLGTGEPAVGDLSADLGPGNEQGIPVRVPVMRGGRPVYVITAVMRPGTFQQILVNQRLPSSWVSGIVGTDGRVLARVPNVDPGALASRDYLDATTNRAEGWYRGKTLEGADSYTAFSRSNLTGWSIGYAVPADVILAGPRRSVYLLTFGMALSVAFALLIGVWLTRRIAGPIGELARAAQWIGTAERIDPVHSDISEVDQLSIAIGKTSASIHERDRLLRESRIELERQAFELREKNANRSRFLALLSHELRNPLAPLRTGLGVLKLRPDEGRRDATEAMMDRQLVHLTRLIDDLLDIGRIDRGQIDLKAQPTELRAVARHAVESATPLISSRQHVLETILPEKEVWVDGDAARLEQVFGNLLANAAKYTPRGGRIELKIETTASRAVLTLSDSGIGFDRNEAEALFEMFSRLPSAEAYDSGGLGIGLSLAKAFVELHHGQILARSDGIGKGAVFTVILPTILEPPRDRGLEVQPSRNEERKSRVVVADDNADAADSLADFLRLQGVEVSVARDGIQALELLRNIRPEVAFIDLNMPGADGYDVARRIRSEGWSDATVLIALTGMGQAQDHRATAEAGFDAHLVKPAEVATVSRLASMTRLEVASWRHNRSGTQPERKLS